MQKVIDAVVILDWGERERREEGRGGRRKPGEETDRERLNRL